jgi:hypothetical protein
MCDWECFAGRIRNHPRPRFAVQRGVCGIGLRGSANAVRGYPTDVQDMHRSDGVTVSSKKNRNRKNVGVLYCLEVSWTSASHDACHDG